MVTSILSTGLRTATTVAVFVTSTVMLCGTSITTKAQRVSAAIDQALEAMSPSEIQQDHIPLQAILQNLNLQRLDAISTDKDTSMDRVHGQHFLERLSLYNTNRVQQKDGTRLIALSAYQISDDRQTTVGRHAVWIRGTDVFTSWMPEVEAVAFFKQLGLPLPNRGVWVQAPTKWMMKWPPENPKTASQAKDGRNEVSEHDKSSAPSATATTVTGGNDLFVMIAGIIALCVASLCVVFWAIRKTHKT